MILDRLTPLPQTFLGEASPRCVFASARCSDLGSLPIGLAGRPKRGLRLANP